MVLGGQTGKRFSVGIGGITAPNASLEVSGTVNITGSLTVSGSSTFTNFGKAILYANAKNEEDLNTSLPDNRALEVSGTTRFHGNTYVTGNLYVSDIVVAQEFHTEYVSASITFTSGSNKMGDTNDDVQMMTGSLRVSGSGVHYFMGKNPTDGPGDGANAKVGIQTINPTYELDVAGDIGVDRSIIHNDDVDTLITFTPDNIALHAGNLTNPKINVTSTGVVFNQNHEATYDLRVEGDADTHLIFADAGVDKVGIGTSVPVQKLQVAGNVSASGVVYGKTGVSGSWVSASQGIWTSGSLNVGNHITASGNISASGYMSASIFAGLSASISHILCTGSGGDGRGTGSFGRINVDRILIHNHEIVGGQGLSVIGESTTLGVAGSNDHLIYMYGNITGSNAWFSGSGGNISASSMTLTNDLTIQGNISGSFISASKGLYSHNNVYAGTHITASGNISASGDLFGNRILVRGVAGAGDGGIHFSHNGTFDDQYIDGFGNQLTIDGDNYVEIVADNEVKINAPKLGIGTVYSTDNADQVPEALTVVGNISGSGALTVQGSGSFGGHVTASGNISASGTGYFSNVYIRKTGSNATLTISSSHDAGIHLIADTDNKTETHNSYIRFEQDAGGVTGWLGFNGSAGQSPINESLTGALINSMILGTQQDTNSQIVQNNTSVLTIDTAANTHLSSSLTVGGNISSSADFDIVSSRDIKASGSISSTNYRTIYIGAGGMTPNDTDGAIARTDELGSGSPTANSHTVDILRFHATTPQYANFQLVMPAEWDQSTIKVRYYWKMTDGTAEDNTVEWGFNATSINDVYLMGDQATFVSTTDTVATPANYKMYVSPASSAITVTLVGPSFDNNNLLFCRVKRVADSLSDDYTGEALLMGVALQYRERVVSEEAW